MAVTSRNLDPLPDQPAPKPAPTAAAFRVPWYYGALLTLFGLVAWPVGAWYTVVGWVGVSNFVLNFVRSPWMIPAPSGLIGLGFAALFGWLYSRVELRPPPLRAGGDWRGLLLAWLAWLFVIGTDAGTTYVGLDTPGIYAGLLAVVLTFAPDQAIMRGWRIIQGKSPF